MARRWAGGGKDSRRVDLAAFGLEAEEETDDEIEIWPENLETVEAFLACRTQWVVGEMTNRMRGLRYADVAATLDLLDVTDRRDVFGGIRIMEAAALEAFAARGTPNE